MTPKELAEIHFDRDEFLRVTQARRDRLFAHIQRCRIDLEGMNDLIAMLTDHKERDTATGSVVMPVPEGADDDNQLDKAA
jgi:hypothetical protein